MNPEKIPLNPTPADHNDLSPYNVTLEAPTVSSELPPRRHRRAWFGRNSANPWAIPQSSSSIKRNILVRGTVLLFVLLALGVGTWIFTTVRPKQDNQNIITQAPQDIQDSGLNNVATDKHVTITVPLKVIKVTNLQQLFVGGISEFQAEASFLNGIKVTGDSVFDGNIAVTGTINGLKFPGIQGTTGRDGVPGAQGLQGIAGTNGSVICPNSRCVSLQDDPFAAAQIGNASLSGRIAAGSLFGDGSGLNNLNATNILAGVLNDARLSGNVALLGAVNSFTGASNSFAGSVGIATASPLYPLDVVGDINSSTALRVGGNVVCTSAGCTAAGTGINFLQGGNSFGATGVLGTNDNNALAIRTNGVERLRLDTSGNIGIGTTNPQAQLQVQATAAGYGATTMTAVSGSTTFTTSTVVTLNAGDTIIPSTSTVQARSVAATATGTSFTVTSPFTGTVNTETFTTEKPVANFTNSAGNSLFYVQGGFGNTGFAAIGSSVPRDKLTLVGTNGFAANLGISRYGSPGGSGSALIFRAANGTEAAPTAEAANSMLGEIDFRGAGSTASTLDYFNSAQIQALSEEAFTDSARGTRLTFSTTANNTTTTQERLRIDNAGNVGIGTTNPTTGRFVVQGTNTNATLGSELVTTTIFTNATWTSTGWTTTPTTVTHITGNTNLLSTSQFTPAIGAVYQVTFTISGNPSAGESVRPSVGGGIGAQIYGNATAQTQLIGATSSSPGVSFTPSANWNGVISAVSVKQVTSSSAVASLLDSAGGNSVEFRANLAANLNTLIGVNAGHSNVSGVRNTALGFNALGVNTTGSNNTAIGLNSLVSNTAGSQNIALGNKALAANSTGINNTAVGFQAGNSSQTTLGDSNTTGSNNTYLGYASNFGTTNQLQNATAIGTYSTVSSKDSVVLGCVGGANGCTATSNIGIGVADVQNRLQVQSNATTGAGTITTVGATVTGSGTSFTTQAKVGDTIIAATQARRITAIGSNTSLTIDTSYYADLSSPTSFTITTPILAVGNTGSTTFKNYVDSTNAFQVQSAAATVLFNVDTTNQRVGIGTPTPTAALDVQGTPISAVATISRYITEVGYATNNPVLNIVNDSTGQFVYTQLALTSKEHGTFNGTVDGGTEILFRTENTSNVVVNRGEIMYNGGGDFLGFGYGSFASHFNGTTGRISLSASNAVLSVPTQNGLVNIGTNTTSNSGGLYFGTDTNLYRSAVGTLKTDGALTVGSSSLFQVSSGGTVTYVDGTTNSATAVCKNTSGQLSACNTTGTGAAFVQSGNAFGATAVLGTTDAQALTFRAGVGTNAAQERLRIDAGGNVGIGTTTPGNLLSIGALTTPDGTGQIAVTTGGVNKKGIIIQAVAGQNVDLLQAQDSAGAVLASIDKVGNLTVKNATINGTLTVNGHIITANASGTTIIAANLAACGTGCTVTITGNDTSGIITVNTGTGVTAGALGTVTFASAYGSAPRVTLTPATVPAASNFPQYYYGATTTTFDLKSYNSLTDSKSYTFSYHVEQ